MAGGPLGVVVCVVDPVDPDPAARRVVEDSVVECFGAEVDEPRVSVLGVDADFAELPELQPHIATTATQTSATWERGGPTLTASIPLRCYRPPVVEPRME